MSCCQKHYGLPEGSEGKTAYHCTGRLMFLPRPENRTQILVVECKCSCHGAGRENDRNKVESIPGNVF